MNCCVTSQGTPRYFAGHLAAETSREQKVRLVDAIRAQQHAPVAASLYSGAGHPSAGGARPVHGRAPPAKKRKSEARREALLRDYI